MTRTHLGITTTSDGARLAHRSDGPKRELCIMACVFCRDPQFWAWMRALAVGGPAEDVEPTETAAKKFILYLCQIASRNALDTDPAAAARFHEMVRLPFLAWKAGMVDIESAA